MVNKTQYNKRKLVRFLLRQIIRIAKRGGRARKVHQQVRAKRYLLRQLRKGRTYGNVPVS